MYDYSAARFHGVISVEALLFSVIKWGMSLYTFLFFFFLSFLFSVQSLSFCTVLYRAVLPLNDTILQNELYDCY